MNNKMNSVEKEIEVVYKMANALKMLNFMKAALTVGIIAFTVFGIATTLFSKD